MNEDRDCEAAQPMNAADGPATSRRAAGVPPVIRITLDGTKDTCGN